MQSMKETAANVAASAKSGMEKTKAIVQEKAEKLSTGDPLQKEMATQKKEERINQAELNKQEVREHNAAARQAASAGGYSTGTRPMSAMPGHDTTGQPTGHVTEGGYGSQYPAGSPEGVVGSQYPVGTNSGMGRTPVRDPNLRGGTDSTGYGTGGTY